MKKITLLILSAFLFLTGCTQKKETIIVESEPIYWFAESVEDIYEEYIPMLNTTVKFTLYDDQVNTDDIYNLLTKYHKLCDSHHYYRDENDELIVNIKYINDYYGNEEGIEITDEMKDILSTAIEYAFITKGYFNPTIANCSELWKPLFSSFPIEGTDPSESDIKQALESVIPYNELTNILEIEGNKLIFHKYNNIEHINLDLGAFSKGYILDILLNYLKDRDCSLLIDEGTSTIAGYSNENRQWNIGISSPQNRYFPLFAVQIQPNECLSTSGDSQKYFLLKDGDNTIIRSHILNPYTGYSEHYYRDVTVIIENEGALSDVLSTALFSIEDEKTILTILREIEEMTNKEVNVIFTLQNDDGSFTLKTTLDSTLILNPSNTIKEIITLEK